MGIKKKRKTRMDFICVNCRVHTVQFRDGKRWICSQCGTPQPIRMKGGKNVRENS
jgi:ribosomal protein L37AE/L43A